MHLEDDFGDIIAKARKGVGCTTTELGHETNLSETAIADIESYRLIPDSDSIGRLATALSLSPPKLQAIAEDNWTPSPPDPSNDTMLIRKIAVPYGSYGENAYVAACRKARLAAVIDPGGAVDEINKVLRDEGLTLDIVLITHAHGDHIGGLKELVANRPRTRIANSQIERDSVTRGLAALWEPAKDGINIHLGELSITPLFTPGHTPGSMCYKTNGACFVGDTLFAGSIGRPASREVYSNMLAEVRSKILSLPDDTVLLPGHGPVTTVAEEKSHNPFF